MQFMPVVSAIIPKLYENSCDYILIIYLKSLDQSHGFEWNLGIARVTGKVIAGAIVSAIYACCECNYSQIVREFM